MMPKKPSTACKSFKDCGPELAIVGGNGEPIRQDVKKRLINDFQFYSEKVCIDSDSDKNDSDLDPLCMKFDRPRKAVLDPDMERQMLEKAPRSSRPPQIPSKRPPAHAKSDEEEE